MMKQKFTRMVGKKNEIECFFTEIKNLNLFFYKKIEIILIHFFFEIRCHDFINQNSSFFFYN